MLVFLSRLLLPISHSSHMAKICYNIYINSGILHSVAAVILYACRMLFPGVLKKDYKKRFRAAFASRRRLKTAEATVNWLISKVRESTGKKADSCIAWCDSSFWKPITRGSAGESRGAHD